MKLKCRIHETDYDIVAGATFSDEYNETLNSGSIVLDHISKIKKLKPYDDVYIWNSDEEFDGYYNIGDILSLEQAHANISLSLNANFKPTDLFTNRTGQIYVDANETEFALSGEVMSIWCYLMFDAPLLAERYTIKPITLQFNMNLTYDDTNVVGYYKLPTVNTDIDLEKGVMKLTKDESIGQVASLPEHIWVSFKRVVSTLQERQNGIIIDAVANEFIGDDLNVYETSIQFDRIVDQDFSTLGDGDEVYAYTQALPNDIPIDSVEIINSEITGTINYVVEDLYLDTSTRRFVFYGYTEQLQQDTYTDITVTYSYQNVIAYKIFEIHPLIYLGETTTSISAGSTTNTIDIDGISVLVTPGNVALYNGNYFEWDGTIWHASDININHLYAYGERHNASYGTFVTTGLSEKQLLSIKNLHINGMVKGYNCTLNLVYASKFQGGVFWLFSTDEDEPKYIYCTLNLVDSETNRWVSNSFLFGLQTPNEPISISEDTGGEILNKPEDVSYTLVDDESGSGFYYYFDVLNNYFYDVRVTMYEKQKLPKFFKHLLVFNYNAQMVDLDRKNYKYTIDLVSETKRLEKTVLPNVSITQPIAVGYKKRTIKYYLQQLLDLYSPKIKKDMGNGKWDYVNKYALDLREPDEIDASDPLTGTPLSAIFNDNIYAPEMALTAPTLREAISRLMIVKDCIPVVKNDVIYAMKISDTHGNYVYDNRHTSFVNESMEGSEYSTALRREHEGAISQKNTAHRVEYLGFRNSTNALMTLENMEVETRFPIYKINKMFMCYYRKVPVIDVNGNSVTRVILVKQDITDLILQNVVRNALPADWTQYQRVSCYDDMKKYRLLTLGFDIGSTKITGWGQSFSYISDWLGWAKATYTYVEIIMTFLDDFFPYGIGRQQFLNDGEQVDTPNLKTWQEMMVTPALAEDEERWSNLNINPIATILKSLFFEIDYIGMYSGAIIHTKDNEDEDDFETPDNSSSSLSILEVDGLHQKEKINRLANPTKSWSARYSDYNEMDGSFNNILGSLFVDAENEQPVIIFHREYQIYDDCVLCNFIGMYDYVMRNYFTSVFAKYRTYSYASYTESIDRKENDKYSVILNKDAQYYESDSMEGSFMPSKILSGFSKSGIDKELKAANTNTINGGFFRFYNDSNGYDEYWGDVNSFVSGYSLCFNLKMFDAITAGLFISTLNCYYEDNGGNNIYVGSQQDWYVMPVESKADGFLKSVGFYFGHFGNDLETVDGEDQAKEKYNELLTLPKKAPTISSIWTVIPNGLNYRISDTTFGKMYDFCKDNKEIIDYTLQYELINYDNDDVVFSEWLLKLSEFGDYVKLTEDTDVIDASSEQILCYTYFGSQYVNWNAIQAALGYNGNTYEHKIVIRIPDNVNPSSLNPDSETGYKHVFANAFNSKPYRFVFQVKVEYLSSLIPLIPDYVLKRIYEIVRLSTKTNILSLDIYYKLLSVEHATSDSITVNVEQTISFGGIVGEQIEDALDNISNGNGNIVIKAPITFEKVSTVGRTGFVDYYWHGQGAFNITQELEKFRYIWWVDLLASIAEGIGKTFNLFLYGTTNGKYFPKGSEWNSKLAVKNSQIAIGNISKNPNIFTYPQTMYILVSDQPLEQSLVYMQLDKDNLPDGFRIIEVDATRIFSLQYDTNENGQLIPYILFNYDEALGTEYQSVQYWYYDYNIGGYGNLSTGEDDSGNNYTSQINGDNLLHFVFGINKTYSQGKTDRIYISTMKHRSKKVYNALHREIGTVLNCKNNPDDYGEQKFEPIDNE
ncbi:MAG: hypothetical protein K5765_06800 [Clostridia bacterium]|nr:hypothetical protein [Clostridia bacterium]